MRLLSLAFLLLIAAPAAQAQYLGNLSANPYAPQALPQPPGTFTNPYGTTGTSPQLRDGDGNFRGNLNANKYDPDSVANPYGQYGSQYSPDSINNQYGRYGSPYSPDSPTNPYGTGLKIYKPRN